MLAATTIKRIFDEDSNPQVKITESDPFMVILLYTELLSVFMDKFKGDLYDSVCKVEKMIEYKPLENMDCNYAQSVDINFMMAAFPRHFSLLHALNNKVIEPLVKVNEVKKEVEQLDQLYPSMFPCLDQAWLGLSSLTREKTVNSNISIYDYNADNTEVVAINAHRAATKLSTIRHWLEPRKWSAPHDLIKINDQKVKEK